jgi:hypothetical protein
MIKTISAMRIAFALTLALAVAMPVSASSPLQSVHLVKDCTDFFSGGNTSTITGSNIPAVVPLGSTISYNGPVFNAVVLSMQVVIETPDGGTATGHCTWPLAVRDSGKCTFAQGTGSLARFHATLSVTGGGGFFFNWDGTYEIID